MDEPKRHYYELIFENKFLKYKSNQFEDFFSEIMEKRYTKDFQRIRPYGNIGDKKCDGYLTIDKEITIFQVYAPNEIKAVDTINKIEEDFAGALGHWKEMNRWVFVYNDQQGLPPNVQQKIKEIQSNNSHISMENWGFESLKKIAFELDENNLASLLGHVPINYNGEDFISILKKTMEEIDEDFVRTFIPALREPVNNSFNMVCQKLLGLNIQDLKRFLHKYRIPSDYKYKDDEGLKEALQLLTLLNMCNPSWRILDSGSANIKLSNNEFRQLLYSVKKETMPEILLGFAERFMGSESRIFKHPLILENFRHHPKKNLCRTCGKEKISYGQILIDYGRGRDQSPFLEVEPNDYSKLDEVIVNCSNCIRAEIEDATTEDELLERIKGVM